MCGDVQPRCADGFRDWLEFANNPWSLPAREKRPVHPWKNGVTVSSSNASCYCQ
jgi:hypothetical protein